MQERLQKLLSQWGIASRRQAEVLIKAGRVKVNGLPVKLGQSADPAQDIVEVDGQVLQPKNRPSHHYFLVNKPLGVVSTCDDPQGRKTVLDLLPAALRQGEGLHPVGRLDVNSTGALLLTNDGKLTYRLTHPSHQIPKVYRVRVQGIPSDAVLQRWRQGVLLDGRKTLPAKVRRLRSKMPDQAYLDITLREGRNRQIRRVAEALGYPVVSLHRLAIGTIRLDQLGRGSYRELTPQEINTLL